MAHRWLVAVLVLVVFASGCDDDDQQRSASETATTEAGETAEVAPRAGDPQPGEGEDLLEGLDEAPTADELAGAAADGVIASADTINAAVPDGACIALTETPARIWPAAGIPAIVAADSRFYVALYARSDAGEDSLHIVETSPERPPRPVRSLRVEPAMRGGRIAPPGIAMDGQHLVLGYVDGDGHVRLASANAREPSAHMPSIEAGSGADPRFAPAIGVVGNTRVIAYTDGSGTPMRVRLTRADRRGALLGTHDLTADGMGAAAPAFAAQADAGGTPTIFFVDPRAGISPIVKAELGPDGSPLPTTVARPVGTVAVPPEVAVGIDGEGNGYAAYTAIGNLATTAVGLMPLQGDNTAPSALVPGTGYGTLNVAATAGPNAVIFAADAPKAQERDAPREIHVRLVRDGTAGDITTVTAPDGTARNVAMARRPDGVIAIAFEASDGVYTAWLRCDD